LSLAVWCWVKNTPEPPDIYKALPNGLFRPYIAQSPATYKRREFKCVEDIYDEINSLEQDNKKFTSGQNLYHLVPIFADINYLLDPWMWEMITEYYYVKNFNISLGELDNINAHRLDCYTVIENELKAIANYERNND